MRWGWVVAGLSIAVAAGGTACRDLLGLHEPIVEGDAGTEASSPIPDADNGEASGVYPAYTPDVPQLDLTPSGAVMRTPQVRAIAFPGDMLAAQAAVGASGWLGSTIWLEQTQEYGVGFGTADPLIALDAAAPATLTDDDIQAWLVAMLDGTHPELGPVDATTLASEVFALVYPQGTTITTPVGTSCQQFTGYHSVVVFDARVATYLVLPRCPASDPPPGDTPIGALTAAGSYELLATVTNPSPRASPAYTTFDPPHVAWNFLNGHGKTELPQACCVPFRTADGGGCTPLLTPNGDAGLAITRSWSNTQIAQYHDPCVPTPNSTPYFASVPIMNDEVSPPGDYPTKGIQIAVGQSKTVDVQLWSDGPTSGPWTVDALVLPGFPADALAFAFNRSTGQNGEKLRLTITAKAASAVPFALVSTLGSKQTTWVGLAGP